MNNYVLIPIPLPLKHIFGPFLKLFELTFCISFTFATITSCDFPISSFGTIFKIKPLGNVSFKKYISVYNNVKLLSNPSVFIDIYPNSIVCNITISPVKYY